MGARRISARRATDRAPGEGQGLGENDISGRALIEEHRHERRLSARDDEDIVGGDLRCRARGSKRRRRAMRGPDPGRWLVVRDSSRSAFRDSAAIASRSRCSVPTGIGR